MEEKKKVGRPKLGTQKKKTLNLTLSEEAKQALAVVSAYKQISQSELVEAFAIREYKKVQREMKKEAK